MSHHAQDRDTDAQAAKDNSAIIHFIIYTSAFLTVTFTLQLYWMVSYLRLLNILRDFFLLFYLLKSKNVFSRKVKHQTRWRQRTENLRESSLLSIRHHQSSYKVCQVVVTVEASNWDSVSHFTFSLFSPELNVMCEEKENAHICWFLSLGFSPTHQFLTLQGNPSLQLCNYFLLFLIAVIM